MVSQRLDLGVHLLADFVEPRLDQLGPFVVDSPLGELGPHRVELVLKGLELGALGRQLVFEIRGDLVPVD